MALLTASLVKLHISGIHLNFNWVPNSLPFQPVYFSHQHNWNFAETLQRVLPLPGLAHYHGTHPSHLDFKKQEDEG